MIGSLYWIVDQMDPQAPESEVEAEIRYRCEDARERGHDIEPDRERYLVGEAIDRHRENRRAVHVLRD